MICWRKCKEMIRFIVGFHVFMFKIVVLMLCCTDLLDYHSTVDEETSEDLTQSCSDKSRGLLQISHSTEQYVFSSECVRVDTSNQLDTAEDCKQSDTPCDDQTHVESGKRKRKKLTHSNNLKRHMLIHNGEKPFSCKVCSKKFTRSSSLKRHMFVHNSDLPLNCKVCNKKFRQSSALKYHLLFHKDEHTFSCKICRKKFTALCNLKRHMFLHNSDLSLNCKVCNKKFRQSSALKYHLLFHKDEHTFSCKFCNKSFTQSSDLKSHVRVHKGDRSFSCKVVKGSLQTHRT